MGAKTARIGKPVTHTELRFDGCIAYPCDEPRLEDSGFCEAHEEASKSYTFKMYTTEEEAGRSAKGDIKK